MRVVLQRVSRAEVRVEGETVASIGRGLLLLVGAADGDSVEDAAKLAAKCADMRIFPDDEGKMNLSLLDLPAGRHGVGGEALVVSQFTLLADTRKGRRPSFVSAAPPETAEPLVEAFAGALREAGVPTRTGRFRATMSVELVNDGPVTVLLDSADFERPRRG